MKKFYGMTPKQYRAAERIKELEHKMLKTTDAVQLSMAFNECKKIWNYNFTTMELMNPDTSWIPDHEKIYNTMCKKLGIYTEERLCAPEKPDHITATDNTTVMVKVGKYTFNWKEV